MSTYFSVDLEYTGPCPSPYHVLSVGCVAFNRDGEELDTFYRAVKHPDGLIWDVDTLQFWQSQGEKFTRLLKEVANGEYSSPVFRDFAEWVYITNNSDDTPVLLADPIAADWPWLAQSFYNAERPNPFKYKGLCIGSYIRAKLNLELWDAVRELYPSEDEHNALADARAQGKGYFWFRDALPEDLIAVREKLTQ